MRNAAFQLLVSLSVAVILYDAGLGLDLRKLRGQTRRVVIRLITLGVPVTWAFGAVFAALTDEDDFNALASANLTGSVE